MNEREREVEHAIAMALREFNDQEGSRRRTLDRTYPGAAAAVAMEVLKEAGWSSPEDWEQVGHLVQDDDDECEWYALPVWDSRPDDDGGWVQHKVSVPMYRRVTP